MSNLSSSQLETAVGVGRLQWHAFESNAANIFQSLAMDTHFTNVTLSCSGANGRSLPAHMAVLAASSDVFKAMLVEQTQHGQTWPYIYLRGVSYNNLCSLVHFMYHGSVNVAPEDLNAFMAAAEELQIKGLAKGTYDQIAEPPSVHLQPGLDTNADPEAAFSANFGQGLSVSTRDQGVMTEKEEEEEEQPPQGIIKGSEGYICMQCGRKFKDRSSAYRHYKNLHTPVKEAKCHVCEKTFKNAYKRNEHRAKVHGITQMMMKNQAMVPKAELSEPDEE